MGPLLQKQGDKGEKLGKLTMLGRFPYPLGIKDGKIKIRGIITDILV